MQSSLTQQLAHTLLVMNLNYCIVMQQQSLMQFEFEFFILTMAPSPIRICCTSEVVTSHPSRTLIYGGGLLGRGGGGGGESLI